MESKKKLEMNKALLIDTIQYMIQELNTELM